MTKSRYLITVIAALLLMHSPALNAAEQLVSPQIDREASEEAFLKAYDHFMSNRMWDCIDELHTSLERNVYFVDAYFMRALAYRRLGRYPEAIAEMTYYMEVRREDPRANTIRDAMVEEWDVITSSIKPENAQAKYSFSASTMQDAFGVPKASVLSLRGMQGLGKAASFGETVYLCDMYGDSLWSFAEGREPMAVDTPLPAACVPLSLTKMLVAGKDGDIRMVSFNYDDISADVELIGSVDANISDAAAIDSTLLAVADRTGQAVKFFSMPSLEQTSQWSPSDVDTSPKLFEPVALAAFGPYIAIADRANERVMVVDTTTLAEIARFSVPSPRDVDWGIEGDLYVLSEEGALYSKIVLAPGDHEMKLVADGMKGAWSLTMAGQGPMICDIAARSWWRSSINPGHRATVGAMSLYSPWLEDRLETENLMLRATVSSLYQDFVQGKRPDTQAIWRNELRPSMVMDIVAASKMAAKVYTPVRDGVSSSSRVTGASSVKDVMADLGASSRRGDEMPRVIVLDSRITATDEDLMLLLAFLMQQGARLDIWAVARPAPTPMMRVSKITLGSTYTARDLDVIPANGSSEWILTIPLPPDTYTFGYPSESTLSVYANVDVIRFIDWMPIWPSLLKKNH